LVTPLGRWAVGLAETGQGPLEAGDVRGPPRAGCEAQQHEFKTWRRCLGLQDGGGCLRALAQIGGGEAALAEVREDRAAHDPLAQLPPVDRHRDRLPEVAADLAERGGAKHDLIAGARRAALQQGG
jgi:hypothetical protein